MREQTLIAAFLALCFVPLSANAQEQNVNEWMHSVASKIVTFNFMDYDKVMEANKIFFTEIGHEKIKRAFERANYPHNIKKGKYILQSEIMCAPQKLKTKTEEGKTIHTLKFPYKTLTLSEKRQRTNYFSVEVVVHEQDGFGIEQWLASPSSKEEISECSDLTE